MEERKLTQEQVDSNLDKLQKNTMGRAMRQLIDDNIEMLDKVSNFPAEPKNESMAVTVMSRQMAIHLLRVFKKRITEDLAKPEDNANIKSEYE